MSDSPLDSTRVLDMMKEFETFLGGTSSKYPRRTFSTTIRQDILSTTKTDPKHESPSSDLKRKLVQKEAEVNHLQVVIANMKSATKSEEPAAKRACIELEKTAENNKMLFEREKEKNVKLSQQLQLLEKENQSLHAALTAEIDQAKALNQQLENKLATSYKKMNLLQVELEELKMDKSGTVKQLQFEINRLKGEIELAEDKINQSKEQMKIVSRQLEEKYLMEKSSLQLEKDGKIREVEHRLARRDEDAVIARSAREELTKLREIEKEFQSLQLQNKNLLERQENTLLLKEKVACLESSLACELKKSNSAQQLSLENKTLKQRLADWEVLGSVHGENRSPANISRYLSRLQKAKALLEEENGQLRAELRIQKVSTNELRKECELAKDENEKLKRTQLSHTNLLRKIHRKQLLLGKECESYKRIINSYEEDVTLNITSTTKERIEMLENLVTEYKNTLTQICSDDPVTAVVERSHLQAEVDNLKQVITKLKEELKNRQIEEKAPESSVKIFHYNMNPTEVALQQRIAEFQRLQSENERLRLRVQVLEDKGGDVTDITAQMQQRIDELGSPSNIKALQEQLNAAELKNKRFLDAFKKTSKEFREACYMMTGYRIDIQGQKKYKLSHMYADSPNDYLLFEQTSDSQLNLLETEYSKSLSNQIQLHLMTQHSIPAFLSSLTLELFNAQTLVLLQQESQLTST